MSKIANFLLSSCIPFVSWVTNTSRVCKTVDLRPQLCIKGEYRGHCLPFWMMLCMIFQLFGTQEDFCKNMTWFLCIPPTAHPFLKEIPMIIIFWELLSSEWIEIVRSVQNRHDSALTKLLMSQWTWVLTFFLCTFLFGLNFVTQAKKKVMD